MKRLAVVLALLLAPAAHAHDGFVDIKNHAFTPGSLTVTEGVLVVWRWDGPDLNHTVTGEGFESDPGKDPLEVAHAEGDTFPVFFDKAGTYAYHCRVHPSMTGTIVVERPPQGDSTPPVLTRVRARVRARRAVVDFRVDESVSVLAEVRRDGKVLRDTFRFVKAGNRRTSVSLAGLGGGSLNIRLEAQDDAGNFSQPRTVSLKR